MSWINPEAVSANVSASDWRAAVREVGKLLVRAGAARPEYTDAMLRTVEELGAYIVLAPGFAMPHARPEDGALRVGFSAITLAEPVEFGNPDNDPVRLVIAFCAPDNSTHVESISQLALRLEVPGFIEDAIDASDASELAQILNREPKR